MAVVTGGNSGIGLAAAKAFAREGASVVITGRDEASLKAAEREVGGGALAIRVDVSSLPAIDSAMAAVRERFKRIDALFVNAGSGKFVPFARVPRQGERRHLRDPHRPTLVDTGEYPVAFAWSRAGPATPFSVRR